MSDVAVPLSLVRLFSDTALLPELLSTPASEWAELLRLAGANLDHVVDSELPQDVPVYAQMAVDAGQFVRRVGLYEGGLTDAGQAIARIGDLAQRSPEGDQVLDEALGRQITAHYRGDKGINVVALLQGAAHLVTRVPGDWAGYCPGLLMGEVRRLLMLAYTDAQRAQRFAEHLVATRVRVARAGEMESPRSDRSRIENANAYGHFINAFHLRAIRRAKRQGVLAPTLTEAQATAIVLTGARLLVQLDALGPMDCLGPPPSDGLPPASLTEPAPLILNDGSVWDRGMQAGLVALLMMHLMNHEFRTDDTRIFPSLAIDMESRQAAANRFGGDPREIGDHRHVNKALAMELLTGMLLARLDSAREVRCYCETRHGMPHKHAPGGLTDVEARYDQPPPGFYVIAAVSAKRDVTRDYYEEQLEQALVHGRALAEAEGVPVYALVLNGGDPVGDEGLAGTFRSFARSAEVGRAGPVRIVPMYAPAFACAVRELEAVLPPDAFRFGTDKLTKSLDTVIAGCLDEEEKVDDDWARQVWRKVLAGEPAMPKRRPRKKDQGPKPP